jgi:hypothetical protein
MGRNPSTDRIGGWVGHRSRAILDALVNRNICVVGFEADSIVDVPITLLWLS